MKHLSLIASVLFAATSAFAHSDVDTTTPANGTVLTSAPTTIDLVFSDKLRLTKVQTSHSSGDTQQLDLDGYDTFADDFTLPMQPMGAGVYQVEWRGLGIDGHAMQGTFSFEVE